MDVARHTLAGLPVVVIEADETYAMDHPPVWASATPTFGSEDTAPTRLQRSGAFAICVVLACATLWAAFLGNGRGPHSSAFISFTGTIWSLADLLTAFLLLAQFYVNGSVFIGLTASAYLLAGLLTWPYLLAFPGIVRLDALSMADHQTSLYLWLIWHAAFPAFVICANSYDAARGSIVSRRRIKLLTGAFVVLPIVASIALSALVFAYHDDLPRLLVNGRFQAIYVRGFVPLIIALNAIACASIAVRRKGVTPLAICIAIAAFSGALDAFLNIQTGWFTYAWDVGKLITVFTATVVLVLILCDIAGVYGRLALVAKIDVLTSLHNRRAFDDYYRAVFKNARRARRGMCVLMVDVDNFKRFNDTYGHQTGDECLRQVARTMAIRMSRPLDLLARYGGEEFVVVLPETPLAGALVVAENIREAVAQLEIAVDAGPKVRVSVSIGVGYIPDASRCDETDLLTAADRGLYDAKTRGRDRIALGTVEVKSPSKTGAPPLSLSA